MEYGSIFETGSNAAFARAGSGFLRADWQLFRSGRDAMRALARNMTFLMKSIALGREAWGLPAREAEKCFTSFPDGL